MKINVPARTRAILLAALGTTLLMPAAQASLDNAYQFNGKGNWSIDGIGGNGTPVGNLSAVVPAGSTIEKAFLYSTWHGGAAGSISSVNFDGTLLNTGDFTALGNNSYLRAFRADVTSQVAAKVGSGSASPFTFSINSESPNASIDGEVLAIIYSNPSESLRTIAFLDGFSLSAGDGTAAYFPGGLPNPTSPGFEALMSLGIGYGYQPAGQYSLVDVNGRRLTTSAGNFDDGAPANGALITVGGLGDSAINPPNPSATDFADDELYNLALGNGVNAAPFINTGDTVINITTQNPSGDDNIFFLGLNITAEGQIFDNPDDVPVVPEPSTVVGGIALAGLVGARMLRRKKA